MERSQRDITVTLFPCAEPTMVIVSIMLERLPRSIVILSH